MGSVSLADDESNSMPFSPSTASMRRPSGVAVTRTFFITCASSGSAAASREKRPLTSAAVACCAVGSPGSSGGGGTGEDSITDGLSCAAWFIARLPSGKMPVRKYIEISLRDCASVDARSHITMNSAIIAVTKSA